MKKLLILLLFIPVFTFGQVSVPNTETFSLQDVYNAVHNHTSGTQTNLQSCFDNAISGYFNPTYNQDSYAPANSMLRFRDYKPTGCSAPTVTTASITDIFGTTATGGGNVTSDGGCTVTARGVCWSTSSNPTIANSKTTDGTGTGSFTSSLTGLTCGTTYYVRAYATNSQGTSYGSQVSFVAYYTNATTDFWYLFSVTATGGSPVYSGTTLTDAQNMCTTISGSYLTSTSSRFYTVGSASVGKSVFVSYAQCPYNVTGYFVYEPDYPAKTNLSIVYILNGVIQSITSCP